MKAAGLNAGSFFYTNAGIVFFSATSPGGDVA